MIKRFFVVISLIILGGIFINMAVHYTEPAGLNPRLAGKYVADGLRELGAPNLVTAVVVTYRGFDTLGEVTVLFISAAGVGLLLRRREDAPGAECGRTPPSELIRTGAAFLVPIIFLLGVYIFVNGHLTPGGGFQGGAVIASGTMLIFLANPGKRLNHRAMDFLESLSGFTYVLIGIAGLIILGSMHFLDNRILGLGEFGTLFSAGAIPLIYTLIGLKVGTELSAILENLKE
ncbi:Na(+)/H(+) antiporter subunit B [bacterium]|nr:Na(+)/H(+) antiporter subunit B [bacterium]